MPSPERPFDDTAPVERTEWLLRLVATGQYDHDRGDLLLGALLPMTGDGDGLSLNREGAIAAADLLATSGNPIVRESGGVLAVSAGWLEEHGFPTSPDPAEVPGHVLVKGMNRIDYDSGGEKKKRIKAVASELLDRINQQGSIRIRPNRLPPPSGG